ncbi:MAG: LCP family protein, partial [Oscillospiraceae bacterium]|nr:LCP family protein [Oscillospiraceae bacterium]
MKGKRQVPRKEGRTRRQKKKRIILLILLCVIAALAITVCITLFRAPNVPEDPVPDQTDVEPTGSSEGIAPALSGDRKDGWYTFLVIGVDDGNGGSDTMMVAAFDTKNKVVNVVSIPRDTLANVSWEPKKLNSAYNHGGVEKVRSEVAKIVGFTPDFYVKIDYKGFIALVDAIGGVWYDVPFNMDYDDPTQNLHIHVAKGYQQLDGNSAAGVVRWRHSSDNRTGYSAGDIGRIQTQQSLLSALAKQLLTVSNLKNVGTFADIFKTYTETNLSLGNMIWFGRQLMGMDTENNIHFTTMPGNYGAMIYSPTYNAKLSYVVLNPTDVAGTVNKYLNPYEGNIPASALNILTVGSNGTLVASGSGAIVPSEPVEVPEDTAEIGDWDAGEDPEDPVEPPALPEPEPEPEP